MSNTFLHLLPDDLSSRFSEVQQLIDLSRKATEHSQVLLKSASVLLISHLEGALKEMVSSFILDVDDAKDYSQLPDFLRREFVSTYVRVDGVKESVNAERIENLDLLLTQCNPNLDPEVFVVGDNRNPSPAIISKTAARLGVENIFSILDASKLKDVFQQQKLSALDSILQDLIHEVKSGSGSYPYKLNLGKFSLLTRIPNPSKVTSFWETFLDSILVRRHKIAHSATYSGELDETALEQDIRMVQILFLGVVLVVGARLS